MNITSIQPSELSADLACRWSTICGDTPEFTSPFFAPEFTQAVGRHRTDVEIGVIKNNGEAVGFFPFQRNVGGGAVPVANRLNDFHGVVLQPGCQLDSEELLDELCLRQWRFHHQVGPQESFAPFVGKCRPSPYAHLTDSFEAYYQDLSSTHHRTFKGQRQRLRGLESHLLQSGMGPLRFEFDVDGGSLLEKLIEWKRLQYRRTKQPDVFAFGWTRALLHDLLSVRHPNFTGVLSALFAGDRTIAIHFGLRWHRCFHCWFPAFDVEFARWSPGLQLWIKLIEAAVQLGVKRIDFGSGGEAFKDRLSNQSTMVAEGVASRYRWQRLCRQTLHRTSGWLRKSPFKQPLKRLAGGVVAAWRRREFR